ncbi:MAG TPA: hemerythrin domain-containing protein [Candidatus Nanopelagicales bacterium]
MTATNPIDVRDMAIVHQTFRRAYGESTRLVRATPTPSAARVRFLADHIDFGVGMLHHHHEGEDELLYPVLIAKVPEQAAHTEEVEHEHQLVAGAIDAVSTACSGWRRRPTAETGEALAAALDSLNAQLQPHLDDEERDIVPLAAVTLTQEEWEAIGEHSRSQIPRNKMAIAFGMLLEPLDDSDRAYMKATLPAPVRLLYPLLIQRPWTKYATTLRNGS